MVTVMLCFARSGGTVLNKCLGCLPDVVILSEVNPLGGSWGKRGKDSLTTVKAQAEGWYGIDLDSDENDFAGCVVELSQKCKHLILRDWSFVNFFPNMGMTLIDDKIELEPPNKFLILDELEGKCDVKPFAFVRDGIDVYLSRGGKLHQFAEVYLNYINELVRLEIPVCRYEDFCVAPDSILKDICAYADLPYTDVLTQYPEFTKVHGDILQSSRGMKQGKIAPLERIKVSNHIIADMNDCVNLQLANKLLGYPISY
jgi:hypothetical protein